MVKVTVCIGSSCHLKGSRLIVEELQRLVAAHGLKDKVDLAKPDLPADLDEPAVDAFNFSSDYPVYIFALSGATDPERLKNLAEDLQDQLERLPGIQGVDLAGTREREVRVEIDLPRLIACRIPLGLVMSRIAQENVTISAGNPAASRRA